MKCNLSSLCRYRKEKVNVSRLNSETYISTENMLPNRGGITSASSLPTTTYTQAFKKGDILVSNIRPYFKKIWQAKFDGGCSNDVLVISANDGTNPIFLYYVLADDTFFDYSMSTSKGTKMPRGDKNSIMLYKAPQMNIETQKKIAKILRSIDDKIELNNRINDNLEQQAQALFKSWFVDFEPFGGIKPSSWKQVSLNELTSMISRGIAPKYTENSDQIIINQKCIRNHMIDLSLTRKHKPKAITEKWLQFGDLLINSTGTGTLGRTAQVWFEPKNLTVDSHVTIVRPTKAELIFYIGFWGIQHEKEIEALHTGSTGQTELARDRVKNIELLLPDTDTLYRFNAVAAPITAAIVANHEQNIKLAQLRDSLLPKLMSGEINVSDIKF